MTITSAVWGGPCIINITNISGDNYTGNALNKSLGKGNTFNGPVYMGGK